MHKSWKLGCVAVAFAAACFGQASAGQLAETNAPKQDKLSVPNLAVECGTPVTTPLLHPDPAAMAYLKNCFSKVAQHNAAVLGAYVVRYILWDPAHDMIAGFTSWKDADAEKGGNEGARIVTSDDAAFPALLDSLRYREWHSVDSFDARFDAGLPQP